MFSPLCHAGCRSELERYQAQMKDYKPPEKVLVPNPALAAGGSGSRKRKRRFKDPNAPKRPRSTYMMFCAEQRAALASSDDARAAATSRAEAATGGGAAPGGPGGRGGGCLAWAGTIM